MKFEIPQQKVSCDTTPKQAGKHIPISPIQYTPPPPPTPQASKSATFVCQAQVQAVCPEGVQGFVYRASVRGS